jgi:hypothetical protein
MARQRSNEERFKIAYRLYKALCLRFPDLLIALSDSRAVSKKVLGTTRQSPLASIDTFMCPTCGAAYRLIRVLADPALADCEIACRNCGAALLGREGDQVLKYFMINQPGKTRASRHV